MKVSIPADMVGTMTVGFDECASRRWASGQAEAMRIAQQTLRSIDALIHAAARNDHRDMFVPFVKAVRTIADLPLKDAHSYVSNEWSKAGSYAEH